MNQPMQAKLCGPFVHSSKRHGLHLQLVSADAEGDDPLGFTGFGGFHHFHRCRGAELPNGVKHPPKTKTAALEWLGRTKQSLKICFRLLLSPKHDANRQRGFHINHVLLEQARCEICGNEGVVVWLTQKRGHPFEGLAKTGEIVKGIAFEDLLLGCLDAVKSYERARRDGLDGAFQVQMKLSFGAGGDLRREQWWFHNQKSMRQSRSARVGPCGEPKGTDVGGRVGELADQNSSCLVIKTIVVFVRIGIFSSKRVAVGQENRFEPAMRAKAGVKRMVGG